MTDDQVDTEEMAENRKLREAGAPATESGAAVAPEQNATAIDADADMLRKPWSKRVWAQLGAWGAYTRVRHPRPE
ncbi:hypothetical protein [Paraburkholderia monticola]|uniref:hypothetical protein n=1 Tax=Paraburkholderia monticola TaxID=1399968 RepID=UPI000AEE9E70|nr:hypothetical protein [Paraburkholderia monticola]